MVRFVLSAFGYAPVAIALLLAALVVVAPIVNAKGRPPRAVFLILPDTVERPELDVQASHLGGGRFLLTLHASAFVFTSVCMAEAEARPVGHAHVHVNGEKVASAYLPSIEIGPLGPGTHAIDVVLRGQDHRAIIARNALVQGRIQLTVPPSPA